jgi:hypothetical protein
MLRWTSPLTTIARIRHQFEQPDSRSATRPILRSLDGVLRPLTSDDIDLPIPRWAVTFGLTRSKGLRMSRWTSPDSAIAKIRHHFEQPCPSLLRPH